MKHFNDYQQYNEAGKKQTLRKITRKFARATRKELDADKIRDTKGNKANRKEARAEKIKIRIENITNKFKNKNLNIKYKIKALNNLIVNFRTSKRNLKNKGDRKSMGEIIKILKNLRSRFKDGDHSERDTTDKLIQIANLAISIEHIDIEDIDEKSTIMKQINDALVEAEDKGIITPKEKEEAIQKGKEKVTGKADKEKEIETQREETPIDTSMKFGEFKTKFKGLETVIKPSSAPLLSRAFEKQKLGVVQFLQLFLNQRNFYSIKEAVELIKDETNVDGFFGEKTENALKAYQTKKELEPTGITDKETWKAIYLDIGLAMDENFKIGSQQTKIRKIEDYKKLFPGLENAVTANSAPFLSEKLNNEKNLNVQFLQQFLKDRNYTVTVTGIFTPETTTALKEYQTKKEIEASGETNAETWKAIYEDIGLTMSNTFKLQEQEQEQEIKKIILTPELENTIIALMNEYMWNPQAYTDEYKVFDLITTKIHNLELNTSNIENFIKRYKQAADEKQANTTRNLKGAAEPRFQPRVTPTITESTHSIKSKGLIQDVIDAFDTSSKAINQRLLLSTFTPIKLLKAEMSKDKKPINAMKLSKKSAKNREAVFSDTQLASELFLNIILLNNQYANKVLADAGITVTFDQINKLISSI